jgi:hypothetical protein
MSGPFVSESSMRSYSGCGMCIRLQDYRLPVHRISRWPVLHRIQIRVPFRHPAFFSCSGFPSWQLRGSSIIRSLSSRKTTGAGCVMNTRPSTLGCASAAEVLPARHRPRPASREGPEAETSPLRKIRLPPQCRAARLRSGASRVSVILLKLQDGDLEISPLPSLLPKKCEDDSGAGLELVRW